MPRVDPQVTLTAPDRTGYGKVPAQIGQLEFTYEDPGVTVATEQRTVEKETIDNQIVVQSLGRAPDEVSIQAQWSIQN
jgi:hypothetical protein